MTHPLLDPPHKVQAMRREQALENALRNLLASASYSTDAMDRAENQAREALALPSDGVNAGMLTALRALLGNMRVCQTMSSELIEQVRNAIARAES